MRHFLLLIILFFFNFSSSIAQVLIIPEPNQMEIKKGEFDFSKFNQIKIPNDAEWERVLHCFFDEFRKTSHIDFKYHKRKGNIIAQKTKNPQLGKEGYRLRIENDELIIEANEAAGLFYALQTLKQLLPPEIYNNQYQKNISWKVSNIHIEDVPRFEYRGSLLDPARYYLEPSFIKKHLDLMAMHKMNVFHWHLTDDQGWRIEIKKYPELTNIGAYRKALDPPHDTIGGYYSQEEIKEIVAYAAERYITIIPEIDLPGHAGAAIAAYPYLGNDTTRRIAVPNTWGVHNYTFRPAPEVFEFLFDVFEEVFKLFPSKYIHIGGDEVKKTEWNRSEYVKAFMASKGMNNANDIQTYFINTVDSFLNSKGKVSIGWDEILDGDISKDAVIMSWRGTRNVKKASDAGHRIILSPNNAYYINYHQYDIKREPRSYPQLIKLSTTYAFEPFINDLDKSKQHLIWGVQANIWGEYIETGHKAEYDAWPRAAAIAETAWSNKKKKNYKHFIKKWNYHQQRLDHLKVNYFGAPINDDFEYFWKSNSIKENRIKPEDIKY